MKRAEDQNYPPVDTFDNLPQRVESAQNAGLDDLEWFISGAEDILSGPVLADAAQGYAQTLGSQASHDLQNMVGTRQRDCGALPQDGQPGQLRSYYRSQYDTDERGTYGFSYDLDNSPFAVHLHTAGSGTILSAVSIKSRADEHGVVRQLDGATVSPV
jgi:hypothetical protein